ncbi:glyoxalase [Dyella sp. S184]|uniref:VOC family protein n=1 Tax=Dyella sp. S184 TaxID=1641862 RepID=UPI00131E66BA|nr:glyoxalase [Dyella sp. S184]
MHINSFTNVVRATITVAVIALLSTAPLSVSLAKEAASNAPGVAVGPQYDTTHVYIAPGDFDTFVNSFTGTFGGKPSPRGTFNVLPVPSSTEGQYVWTPVGTLSTFAFLTPIPYPFGQERTGYLVTDMDQALKLARVAGAEVIVDKFKDPIGFDAVIQWPGGVKMQLYWHFKAPSYGVLETVPDNRIYVSRDAADTFVRDWLRFSQGKVVADDRKADAGEIGKPGETYRRIRIESGFGKMQVNVTDGHLPYPFGHEISGYEVKDLDATLAKATSNGAKVLVPRYDASDRSSAIVQFPGGYIVEVHATKAH